MELNNQQALPVPRLQAWEALNDLEILKASIPGCESFESVGEGQFELTVAAAIGPVKARFRSKLQLLDVQAPVSYTMQFDGQGGAAGFGKGTANVQLLETDDGLCTLEYAVKAQVGGKIAQIGSRLIDMAARKLAQEFFDNFGRVLAERYLEPATDADAATAGETEGETSAGGRWAGIRKIFKKD